MIGKTISHYNILEKLGEGGMGVVYKAEDTKLKRTVALKFLPPELTRDKDAKTRFIHEARAASALQHHNICTIHGIEETGDGHVFISMDRYEGETLKEKIAKGPLPLEEAIDIVSQAAAGFSEAHAAGMVHRDIKPANIMVTDKGVVKILDFGLAKLAGATKITKTGMTVGTVAYMSPEQARGAETDSRSDIWSLGAVLYELVTGVPPFRGDHVAAVMYGIMNTEPAPLATYRDDVSGDLQRIVDTALSRDTASRYESAAELAADLDQFRDGGPVGARARRKRSRPRGLVMAAAAVLVLLGAYLGYSRFFSPGTGGGDVPRKMIAVLPFDNIGSPDDEYFADGITDELTARLAVVQGLGVIARTSSIQYRDTDKSIQQIGEELGVDYILEGTIRWQRTSDGTSEVRVTPQLISVSDATQLWANVYDQPLTEIFEAQTDIAVMVVSALNVSLLESAREMIEKKPTDNLDAFDYYLRGNEYYYDATAEYRRFILAAQFYEQAVELDPDFAEAHARLSVAYTEIYWHLGKEEEVLTTARDAMDRALELDPELPEAHEALGSAFYHDSEHERALEEYNRALEAKPADSQVLREIGFIHRMMGDDRRSLQFFEKAAILDPRSGVTLMHVGVAYARLNNYDRAETELIKGIHLDPDEPMIRGFLAQTYVLHNGDTESALNVLQEASSMVAIDGFIANIWMKIDILAGNYASALERLEQTNGDPVVYESQKAYIHGLMDDTESERRHYQSALGHLEERGAKDSDDAMEHIILGMVYAGLGRAKDAVAEADRVGQLVAPASRNYVAYRGQTKGRAEIYAAAGEDEKAIDLLEELLLGPGLTKHWYRLDPRYASLRDHPRFQALVGE